MHQPLEAGQGHLSWAELLSPKGFHLPRFSPARVPERLLQAWGTLTAQPCLGEGSCDKSTGKLRTSADCDGDESSGEPRRVGCLMEGIRECGLDRT